MVFICPPTQVTTVAPCSLNLVTSALYMRICNDKLTISASSEQINRLS